MRYGFLAITLAALGCGEADGATPGTGSQAVSGQTEFESATFGGNGRTCATCHDEQNAFTLSPARVQQRHAADPDDPLFRSLDSDDGAGASYARLLAHATIRVVMPLPATVRLHDDPTATAAVVQRGIPSVENVALEPVLMSDGREPTLRAQASGAIQAHLEPTVEPTSKQIDKIVKYESAQFSSAALQAAARGGPDPGLPAGRTESEQRGREFFLAGGRCGICHSGPLLNQTSNEHPFLPPGVRFEVIFAGFPEFLGGAPPANAAGDIRLWDFKCPDGPSFVCDNAATLGFTVAAGWVTLPARDPGVALATGNPDDAFAFKITGLRNIGRTAPYFHDNSAATLEDVVAHYDLFFTAFEGIGLSAAEQADIVAYMRLL